MKGRKNCLLYIFALLMCLSLAACSANSGDDINNGNNGNSEKDVSTVAMDVMSASEFDENSLCWQGDDGSELTLDFDSGSYTYRTWYNRAGVGELIQDGDGVSIKISDTSSDNYYYLVRDTSGFTVRHVNGEEGKQWGEINGIHFEKSQAEPTPFDLSLLDGVWQNALGQTYAFNTELMRVIYCHDGVLDSGRLYDKNGGLGPFVGGSDILYPCLSEDGNAFVFFTESGNTISSDSLSTGVFYRDGDVGKYADLKNASFSESDGRLWYFDGVRYFALPDGYSINSDGRAYSGDGKPFAPEWSGEKYDPTKVWGENWLNDNWGSN